MSAKYGISFLVLKSIIQISSKPAFLSLHSPIRMMGSQKMMASEFNEPRFRKRVDAALGKVRQILDNTRNPVYAADVRHTYQDKFTVTEFLIMTSLACNIHVLSSIGVSAEMLKTLLEWSKTRTVSLRFRSEEKCAFDREESKDVDSADKTVTTSRLGNFEMFSSKVVTTITEYFWKYEGKYELIAFAGVGNEATDQQLILSRSYRHELVTRVKTNPRFERKQDGNFDVDITSFLTCVKPEDLSVTFSIDRENAACRTPRRNPEVDKTIQSFRRLQSWCLNVRQHMLDNVFAVWSGHELDLSVINSQGIFGPVLPLLEDTKSGLTTQQQLDELRADDCAAAASDRPQNTAIITSEASPPAATRDAAAEVPVTLRSADMASFLAEERRSLAQRQTDVAKVLPPGASGKVITAAEGQLLVGILHLSDVVDHLVDSLGYIEDMLRKQLIAAVGRVVTPADFSAYMRFHNRRLFRPEYAPRPFCYAVRRTAQHSPEGHISIEETPSAGGGGEISDPIYTVVLHAPRAPHAMEFALNAATTVRFGGERYLHAWVRHSFAGQPAAWEVYLAAQARQFSSFIVLVGTIASATEFEPKCGLIVQNKDDLRVPLILDTIPSPKEFRDAIQSLSPDQQAFARAFRGMQLASTLFAVLIVQIKPQMERLLNLSPESLTKEIKLTQDLTELFIKYQIPADLLTCGAIAPAATAADAAGGDRPPSGAATAATAAPASGRDGAADKVAEVKRHVAAMYELIEGEKRKQLQDKQAQAAHSVLDDFASGDSAPPGPFTTTMVPTPAPVARRTFQGGEMEEGLNLEGCNVGYDAGKPPANPPPPQANALPPPPPWDGEFRDAAVAGTPSSGDRAGDGGAACGDYTKLPGLLDKRVEALDPDSALRPTTVRPGEAWTKRSFPSLLSSAAGEPATLRAEGQRAERGRAFELLDALTRGGALELEETSLHVVLAATHGFDKGVVDTVVSDGVNPVDKAERSTLIVASGVAGVPAAEMVKVEQLPRLRGVTPGLFVEGPTSLEG